ncbi:N-acetylneuraminate synthase family protein [Candidatus Pelagibacter sp.]|nr:N-acetylneuraminate synthase family protein [Candidatus Pelagibacter sp.]|tara:strand:+ start:356 stop:1198 length:843 start_codon:yes stop_codon:yes gene_type:complete
MKKPYLIAEIGINHNGDVKITKQLIKNAKDCGFDSVKFQKRTINIVYDEKTLDTLRESPWGKTTREQKLGLEFEKPEYDEIDKYCKELNIDWFASAWDIESLKFLENYNLKYHKIASAMIVDHKFLNEVAKTHKHTFISTGMSSKEDIDNAVNIFKKNDCSFELMHCVSTYPMKIEDANLITINQLKNEYNCNVGYSGHENGVVVSLAATMLGITSLERHITLDRTMYGSDQSASLELSGMQNLSSSINKLLLSLGEPSLGKIIDEEIPIAKKLRAHIKN